MLKKRLSALTLALVLSCGLAVPATAKDSTPFEDVPASAWYYDDVSAVYRSGILNGISETTFAPTGTLSLAQAVTLAARLHQYTSKGTLTLENGSNPWYITFVRYAKAEGIIGNEYDGRWDESAARVEVVKVLYRSMDYADYVGINHVLDNAIPDVKAGDEAFAEIYTFFRAGILTGDQNNCFLPQSAIQRCEVAAILNRMLDPSRRKSITLTGAPFQPLGGKAPAGSLLSSSAGVLSLLDYYDPDGAWILRAAAGSHKDAGDFLSYFDSSSSLEPIYHVSTAVHEECHLFTASDVKDTRYNSVQDIYTLALEHIYLGGGCYLDVPLTDVFPSSEIAAGIPEALRTSRFETYVNTDESLVSNTYGIYGLLNEFAAYCWDSNTSWRLREYRHSNGWYRESDSFTAYAEFRFFILRYMLYAQEHHPEVYQGILDNDSFRLAFSTLDSIFGDIAKTVRESQQLYAREHDLLMTEMEKPEYRALAALLCL